MQQFQLKPTLTKKIPKLFITLLFKATLSQGPPPGPPPRGCAAASKSERKFFTQTVTGGTSEEISLNCLNSQQKIRLHSWIKIRSLPIAENTKKQVLMRIPNNNILVYLVSNNGNYEVRADVGANENVVAKGFSNTIVGEWCVLSLDVNRTDIRLSFFGVDFNVGDGNHASATLGTAYAFPSTTANKVLQMVKPSLSTEEGFIGSIASYGYSCDPLPSDCTNNNRSCVIAHSQASVAKALYFIQNDAEFWPNLIFKNKEPVLTNGPTRANEPQDEAWYSGTRVLIGNNKFMKVNMIDLGYSVDELFYGISVVISGNMTTIPVVTQKSIFLTIEAEKIVNFYVDENGLVEVEIDGSGGMWSSEVYWSQGIDQTMKFFVGVIVRTGTAIVHVEDYSVDFGLIGGKSTNVIWTQLPSPATSSIPGYWTVTFGSSTNPSSHAYTLAIDSILITQGNALIRTPKSNDLSCKGGQSDLDCRVEFSHSTNEICLNCTQSNDPGLEWFVNTNKADVLCVKPVNSIPPIPSDVVTTSASDIWYMNIGKKFSQPCEYGKYKTSTTATTCSGTCNAACGGSCVDQTAAKCNGCDWSNSQYLAGVAPNSCTTCAFTPLDQTFGNGKCTNCLVPDSGCSSCYMGLCSSCPNGGETPLLGVCCNLETHYLKNTGGVISCEACHANCLSCDGPGAESCVECQGYVDKVDGVCPTPSSCAPNQWNDNSVCTDCPTGCLTCSSNLVCNSCDTGYAFEGTVCVSCPVSGNPGKWVNNNISPATCDSCPANCATCNSDTTCITCTSGYGLHNSLCVDCPSVGAFFLDNVNCAQCATDCTACTSGTVCTNCIPAKYLKEDDTCGDCDNTNGFRRDDAVSPKRCYACPVSCLECTDSTCTKCTSGMGWDAVQNKCIVCPVGKYITSLNQQNIAETCVNCPTGCTACTSSTVCSTCAASYTLNGICEFCDTTNGYYIKSSTSCLQCGENCKICSNSGATCDTCLDAHTNDEDGTCTPCSVNNGQFISGGTCLNCIADCKTCTTSSSCDLCSPGFYFKSGTSQCQACDINNGMFVNLGGVSQSCDNCGDLCQVCVDFDNCSSCEIGNGDVHLSKGVCIQCDFGANMFIDEAKGTCSQCFGGCDGCVFESGNCLKCQSGYVFLSEDESHLATESNCLLKEKYEELTTSKTEPGCHESCISCTEPNNKLRCSTCPNEKCLKTTGECSDCPPLEQIITNPDDFLQTSKMTFFTTQRFLNDVTNYQIDFSEEEIFFDSSIDTKKIHEYIEVTLSNSKTPEDYTSSITFSSPQNKILISLTFKASIPSSTLTTKILNPEKIHSSQGKVLRNSISKIDFPGYTFLNKRTKSALKLLSDSSKSTSSGALATSSGTLVVSSLFSNALASLSKLIQIIEFSALMELFNIRYDESMGGFLNSVSKATEFDLVKGPGGRIVDGEKSGKAGVWKGKLSMVGSNAYFLQDLGYPGIVMIIIYLVQSYYFIKRKLPPRRFTMLRISLFNSLLIDYASISFRTLGYYPSVSSSSKSFGEHLSYILSTFITIFFANEFIFMYHKSNDPNFYKTLKNSKNPKISKNLKNKKSLNSDLQEVFYDGINPTLISKNWFARNYNFLYLLRFYIVCLLIFNLQYLQILQSLASLIIMVTFSTLTFYNQIKYKIFSSSYVAGYRLVQETSMTIIMILINLFMYDSFQGILTPGSKITFVFIFIGLLVLNILLEISGVFVLLGGVLKDFYKRWKEKRAKEKKNKVVPVVPGERLDDFSDGNRILNDYGDGEFSPKKNFGKVENSGKNSGLFSPKNFLNKEKIGGRVSISLRRRTSKMMKSPFAKSKLVNEGKRRSYISGKSDVSKGTRKTLREVEKKKSGFYDKAERGNNDLKDDKSIESFEI